MGLGIRSDRPSLANLESKASNRDWNSPMARYAEEDSQGHRPVTVTPAKRRLRPEMHLVKWFSPHF